MQVVSDQGAIEAVTLYPGRAAVTRAVRRDLAQGVWTVRIGNLPASVQASSLQAKVARAGDSAAKAPPKLLGVEYSETQRATFEGTPEGVALQEKIEKLKRLTGELAQDRALLAAQDKLADQIGVRAAANATNDGATQPLDLEAAAKQLEFVRSEKLRILAEARGLDDKERQLHEELAAAEAQLAARGGASRTERTALVMIAVPEGAAVEVELTYLVADAGWEPSYAVRASADRSGVAVEYDAMISQRTGEDWNGVRMSLSTAQPTRASGPPPVAPWFVDIVVPVDPQAQGMVTGAPAAMEGAKAMNAEPTVQFDAGVALARKRLEEISAPATVQETGVAVSFDLPRAVTIPTDDKKKQRTRIGAFEPGAAFVYVAAPIVTESVFLRGDLTNTSAFQLLPGKAQIFMGGEFIGESQMPSVAPQDEFKVFFGPDRALHAKREVLSKTTGASGLFGSSTSTLWKERISIDNGTGRDVKMEVFDRRVVSRNDKIEVRTADLSPPLSTNKQYLETLFPQGILRWDLTAPATARGPKSTVISWSVEVIRANDIRTTPLPD